MSESPPTQRPTWRGAAVVAVVCWPTLAAAEEPRPDRPVRTLTGDLVSPRSVELEAGGAWQGERPAAPLRLKIGAGPVEPRLTMDLAGIGYGEPGLTAGLKAGLVRDEAIGLALYGQSVVPLGFGESWTGEGGGALSLHLASGASLRVNAALRLVGDGGALDVGGVPLRGLLSVPVGDKVRPFGEVEAVLSPTNPAWTLNGGVLLSLTDALVADAAFGWDLELGAPIVQVGLTANVGRLR